jgi:4-hydroxybenzoate polyprenyltransferase
MSVLSSFAHLARWSDWSTSKLPFLGAAALLLAPDTSALSIGAMLCSVLCWAAFGYCINDVADRATDRRAGKGNRAADVSTATWAVFLALSAAGSVFFSLYWAADLIAPALVVVGLVLASAYSLPPIRLKERGAVGLAAGAISQWMVPVLAVSAAHPDGWRHPAAWCVALLGLAIGIRWMAVHQLQDSAGDRRAGVRTFAAMGGRTWRVLLGAFIAEVPVLAAALILTWPQSVAAVAAFVFWIAQDALLRPHDESIRKRLQGYDRAPLAEYYFLLLPLSLAIAQAVSSPAFLAVAAAFVALGWCYVEMMTGEWYETCTRARSP